MVEPMHLFGRGTETDFTSVESEPVEVHDEQANTPPPIPKTGRRAAPRLRLSLPARLTAIEGTHQCVLMNISRTGAQIAILNPLRVGEGAVLKCAKLDSFVIVTRTEFSVNALEFEEPLSDELVLSIRRHYENFEERERRQLIETARKWAMGDSDDERAI